MNNLSKILIAQLITATLFLGLAIPSYGQRNIGDATVGAQRDVIPVVVRSRDATAMNILRTAFSIHGKYKVVSSMNQAAFAIQVDPAGGNQASIRITRGNPEQFFRSGTTQGTSARNAVLKGVDFAIRQTAQMPGFFGGKIAYVGEVGGATEIYARDFLFGEGLKLTNHRVEVLRPRWSPDGNYVVYTSYLSGFPNIRRIDLRNQRSDVLANFKGTNTSARYSPDGSRLVMVLTGRGGTSDVFVGNNQARGLKLVANSNGLEAAPCWSPDGREIIFVSDRTGPLALYRGSPNGGQFSRIPTNISGYCSEPDWNPHDPDQVAFTIGQSGGFQVASYSLGQRRSVTLTNERGDALHPCWLNDGRHILYTWRTGSSERIVLLDTVSKRRTVLSPAVLGKASQPSFLPPRG